MKFNCVKCSHKLGLEDVKWTVPFTATYKLEGFFCAAFEHQIGWYAKIRVYVKIRAVVEHIHIGGRAENNVSAYTIPVQPQTFVAAPCRLLFDLYAD